MGVPNMLQKSISKLGCDGGITMVKPVVYLGKPIGWVDHLEMETFSIWGSESVFFFLGMACRRLAMLLGVIGRGPQSIHKFIGNGSQLDLEWIYDATCYAQHR